MQVRRWTMRPMSGGSQRNLLVYLYLKVPRTVSFRAELVLVEYHIIVNLWTAARSCLVPTSEETTRLAVNHLLELILPIGQNFQSAKTESCCD